MHWLQTLDLELFRFCNLKLANPFLDWLMPLMSGNHSSFMLLYAVSVFTAIVLVCKDRTRGLVFLLMLALVLALGDGFLCNTIKHAIARPRPCVAVADAHFLVGKSGSGSMPSSHAANWFAATMISLIYYRRSVWFMLPAALLVSFSRVYCGAHYPSDVLAGATLGAGEAAATFWAVSALWFYSGRRWFPLWWQRMPTLLGPARSTGGSEEDEELLPPPEMPVRRGIAPAGFRAPHATLDEHWLRLGYVWIACLLAGRLLYIASGTIQLAEDEAYQWLWSKHLALSFYSKPPLIAVVQWIGTGLWGDTAFGVRFFSPIIAAVISVASLRFFAREFNARAGFFLVVVLTAVPLTAVGSVLLTVDPLSVLFWTLAMVAGWRAVQDKATTGDWVWVGLWMGLGFLSKYTALLQWLCWAVFFALWPSARRQLRRPGPYMALLVNSLCALPVLIWNWQHGWVTIAHVADDASVGQAWQPTLKYLGEFLGSELVLLNPIFFLAVVWAAVALWRTGRHNPRLIYLFSMGAPLFLVYLAHSLRGRVLPNWIAPSVVPLFCLAVAYWDTRWRLGVATTPGWLTPRFLISLALSAGLGLGLSMVAVGYQTDFARKLTGHYLPVRWDPLHRVREWDATARAVNDARRSLMGEGKPVFIIADHYGLTGQISFYLPEARDAIRHTPMVYCRSSAVPENQFYFWPGYQQRRGENAVYVRELNRDDPEPRPPPLLLQSEFESVMDLGITNVMYHGFLLRPLQLFACRSLR